MGLFLSYCPYSEKMKSLKVRKCKMQFFGGKKTKKWGINEKKKRVVNGNLIQTFN